MASRQTYLDRKSLTPETEAADLAAFVWQTAMAGIEAGAPYDASDVARSQAVFRDPDFDAEDYIQSLLCDDGYLHSTGEFLLACAAYCEGASRAFAQGEERVAWTYMMNAIEMVGLFNQDQAARGVKIESVRFALDARHTENRAMRQQAEEWYRVALLSDRTLTKDAAAEAIAGKIVPMKFRTVRGWLSKLT